MLNMASLKRQITPYRPTPLSSTSSSPPVASTTLPYPQDEESMPYPTQTVIRPAPPLSPAHQHHLSPSASSPITATSSRTPLLQIQPPSPHFPPSPHTLLPPAPVLPATHTEPPTSPRHRDPTNTGANEPATAVIPRWSPDSSAAVNPNLPPPPAYDTPLSRPRTRSNEDADGTNTSLYSYPASESGSPPRKKRPVLVLGGGAGGASPPGKGYRHGHGRHGGSAAQSKSTIGSFGSSFLEASSMGGDPEGKVMTSEDLAARSLRRRKMKLAAWSCGLGICLLVLVGLAIGIGVGVVGRGSGSGSDS